MCILHDVDTIFAGTSEAIATYRALEGIRPTKRPFVLTRSNYPGVGAYAAHWNGNYEVTLTLYAFLIAS